MAGEAALQKKSKVGRDDDEKLQGVDGRNERGKKEVVGSGEGGAAYEKDLLDFDT